MKSFLKNKNISCKTMNKSNKLNIKYLVFICFILISLEFAFETNIMAQTKTSHSTILKDLKFEKIKFQPRKIKEERIKNTNARLFLMEDNSLPYLDITIIFPGQGIIHEPIDNAGLFEATMTLMKKGGAGGKSSDQTAKILSGLGAKMDITHSQNSWQISLRVLTDKMDPAFKILSETLINPTLEKKIWETIKKNSIAKIDRRNQKPSSIAHRKLKEIMYFGSRLGYSLQKKDINRLDYNTIKKNSKAIIASQPRLVGISGDIRNTQIRNKLSRLLSKLPVEPENSKTSISFNSQTNKRFLKNIYLIEKKVPQSIILMSGFIPAKKDPDFYALQTGNYILGGGSFNSRLMKEIRVNRGLAYYAYSHNVFFKHYGRFLAGTATRSAKVGETFALMQDTIRTMHHKVSKQELHLAKESILNSLVFAFDTPQKRLSSELTNFMQNLKPDYLVAFPDDIQKQNQLSIQSAYKRSIKLKNMFKIVVGPLSIKDKLATFGNVVVLQPEESISQN